MRLSGGCAARLRLWLPVRICSVMCFRRVICRVFCMVLSFACLQADVTGMDMYVCVCVWIHEHNMFRFMLSAHLSSFNDIRPGRIKALLEHIALCLVGVIEKRDMNK